MGCGVRGGVEGERERERSTHTYPSFERGLPQMCPCGSLSHTGEPRYVHYGGGKKQHNTLSI